MSVTCGECGGSLEDEEGYLTCTECGNCQDTPNFAIQEQRQYSQNYSTNSVHQPEFAVASRRKDLRISTTNCSRYLNLWRGIISAGSDALRISRTARERAVLLFEKAYRHGGSVKAGKMGYKRGLCAACLHVACSDELRAVGISEICEAVQAKKSFYCKARKDLKRLEGVDVAPGNPLDEEGVSMCLRKHGHGEIETNIRGSVLQILELAKEHHMETGCRADALILAAAFLASQRVTGGGCKREDLDRFLEKSNTPKYSVYKRLRELQDMLYFMSQKVPWLDASMVGKKEAVKYLEEIVKHQGSVRLTRSSSDSEGNNDILGGERYKLKRKNNHVSDVGGERGGDLPCSDVSVRTRGQDLERPELDENDIPESEMDQYIHQDKAKDQVKLLHLL